MDKFVEFLHDILTLKLDRNFKIINYYEKLSAVEFELAKRIPEEVQECFRAYITMEEKYYKLFERELIRLTLEFVQNCIKDYKE